MSLKELYYNFLKEDRLDILEIYLQLIKNQTLESITVSQIENMKVLELFYRNPEMVKFVNNEESRFFSPTTFGSLTKHYNSMF